MLRFLLAALLAMLAISAPASADLVEMKDGRVFIGVIKFEDKQTIAIDTVVSNVRSLMTLKRSDIHRIEKGELPDGFFDTGKKDRAAAPASAGAPNRSAPSAAGAVKYLEIPLEGTFGEEIKASGVESALSWASKQKIEHIVFRINSPGGSVQEATDISKAMERYGSSMKFHALIESAISASIWIAFGCDNIFMTPGATMGGAVAFTRDRTTGAAEVDAKMNSILTAEVVAVASRKGHNPEVVRAMMITDASLYTWTDGSGEIRIGAEPPKERNAPKAERIDGPATVLTLTSADAERLGVAKVVSGGIDRLGDSLAINAWASAGPFGVNTMKRTAAQQQKAVRRGDTDEQKAEQLLRNVQMQVDLIVRNIEEAVALDPKNFDDYRFDRIGNAMTVDSQGRWRQRTDDALAAWQRVGRGVVTLEKLMREAEKMGGDITEFTVSMRDFKQRADREVERLRRERNRS